LSLAEVAVIMGSKSDRPVMDRACKMLDKLGISYQAIVMSAHRNPRTTREFAATAARRGFKVIIAGAGMAAHLAGVVAAETTLPVIGVPLAGSALGGVDALYSMVQMPSGVPVATVAVGEAGAHNAAVLAGQILALGRPALQRRLKAYKRSLGK
jgi:5-(carboxyamino)imidazole ribonucleotide mutase